MSDEVNVLTLTGDIESSLSHFSGLGVAAIVADRAGIRPRIRWTTGEVPRFQIAVGPLTPIDAAAAILAHAREAAAENSWVQCTVEHEKRTGVGLFSPRIKPASTPESLHALDRARGSVLTQLEREGRVLDLAMIAGLGEPAYWRSERGEPRPDHGASKWEMKARNRGEEFVGNRLSKMAKVVAARTPESVLAGLTGEVVVDDLGSGASSQTATGFSTPGEVDTARAWCALWGMTQFPVVHDAHAPSRTPCAHPPRVLHPQWMTLPVVERWMSLPAFKNVLVSPACDQLGAIITATGAEPASDDQVARTWLAEHGVAGMVRFGIKKEGSSSAPQRFVLRGEIVPVSTESE